MRQLTRLIALTPILASVADPVFRSGFAGSGESARRIQADLACPSGIDRVLEPRSHWLWRHSTVQHSADHALFSVPAATAVPIHTSTNAWNIVAFALVASTILKGLCDYAGTYLVNHAGFGMITDLRDDLYNAILRRSAAFFSRHTTGTLLSTIVNVHRAGAVCHVHRAGGVSPAVLHIPVCRAES